MSLGKNGESANYMRSAYDRRVLNKCCLPNWLLHSWRSRKGDFWHHSNWFPLIFMNIAQTYIPTHTRWVLKATERVSRQANCSDMLYTQTFTSMAKNYRKTSTIKLLSLVWVFPKGTLHQVTWCGALFGKKTVQGLVLSTVSFLLQLLQMRCLPPATDKSAFPGRARLRLLWKNSESVKTTDTRLACSCA